MKIALGADHRGAASIKMLAEKLRREGHEISLLDDCAGQVCDYPEKAYTVGKAVADHRADLGILICGTGVGMSIAANKVRGVRAAVVHDELTAQLSRSHNDANILCFGSRVVGPGVAAELVSAFLGTEYEGGRHAARVAKIDV